MDVILKKLNESAVTRVVAIGVLSGVLGIGGSAGVAWYHGEPSAAQDEKLREHEQRLRQMDLNLQQLRESISELRGTAQSLLQAIQAENEGRRRDDDRMDERLRYLERHR